MGALRFVVPVGLIFAVTGAAGAAGVASQVESTPAAGPAASFVPGPPLWRPAEMRPKAKSTNQDLEGTIDRCVTDAMAAIDTPGASVAVMIDGEMFYEEGYGVKQRGETATVNSTTQFRIGSATKMLTAAALMQQVEAGTVFLDDRVTRHIPELDFLGHFPDEVMTVEQLLTHATGIPDLNFRPDGEVGPDALSDWALSLNDIGLHVPPGTFYNYSNPNFNLAGLVVERASGTDYRSYMAAGVFQPAGMNRTTFDPAEVVAGGNFTYGHTPDGAEGEIVFAPDDYDNGAFTPAGYAFSTAGDLVRWAMLLSEGGGEVLSGESAAAMQTLQRSLDIMPGYGYGYGIFIEPFYDLTLRQHGGNIWGWGTHVLWHPERRFAVAVLANTFQALPDAAYCIATEVLEPDFGTTIDPAEPDMGRWQRLFEGTYDVTMRTTVKPIPYPATGELLFVGSEELILYLTDPVTGWDLIWVLDYVAFDYFLIDADGDGTHDLDLSFHTSPTEPERLRWMRMRPVVGSPYVAPRHGQRPIP